MGALADDADARLAQAAEWLHRPWRADVLEPEWTRESIWYRRLGNEWGSGPSPCCGRAGHPEVVGSSCHNHCANVAAGPFAEHGLMVDRPIPRRNGANLSRDRLYPLSPMIRLRNAQSGERTHFDTAPNCHWAGARSRRTSPTCSPTSDVRNPRSERHPKGETRKGRVRGGLPNTFPTQGQGRVLPSDFGLTSGFGTSGLIPAMNGTRQRKRGDLKSPRCDG